MSNSTQVRQAAASISIADQAMAATPNVRFQVNDGIASEGTIEVRLNIRGGNRGYKINDRGAGTLFEYHGGRLLYTTKGDYFLTFWLDAPEYKGKVLQFDDQGVKTTNVWSKLVTKKEANVPVGIAPMISLLKADPERANAMLAALPAEQADELRGYLDSGLKYTQLDTKAMLNHLFGHSLIKFKSTINRHAEQIEQIQSQLADGETYTLVLRFNLIEQLNAASELKVMQHAGNAIYYPLTNTPVSYKEVYVNISYIGVEQGNTYEVDTTKYVNPELVREALLVGAQSKQEAPRYLDTAKLRAEAESVNAYKQTIDQASGKKWLQKAGYTSKEVGGSVFFQLALKAANGDGVAAMEYSHMERALLQAAGVKPAFSRDNAEAIIRAAQEYAQANKHVPAMTDLAMDLNDMDAEIDLSGL